MTAEGFAGASSSGTHVLQAHFVPCVLAPLAFRRPRAQPGEGQLPRELAR
jgi:hypothetical protein